MTRQNILILYKEIQRHPAQPITYYQEMTDLDFPTFQKTLKTLLLNKMIKQKGKNLEPYLG